MKLGVKQSTKSRAMFIKTVAVILLTIAIYSKLFINMFMAATNECCQYWCTQFTHISALKFERGESHTFKDYSFKCRTKPCYECLHGGVATFIT